jgi:hypothetical protein
MRTAATVLIAALLPAAGVSAQCQRRDARFGFNEKIPENPKHDGAFRFSLIRFRNALKADAAGSIVDDPRADENLTTH